jgi:DNA-binding IscR family transcriptional regulator
MDKQQVSMMVGTLRGAPASVLLAMLLLGGGPLQVVELEEITGYARQTVSKGLRRLSSLDLVHKMPGRYEGWVLKVKVRQMVLGEAVDADVKNFNVGSSSSSSRSNGKVLDSQREQLQLPSGEVKKFNLDSSVKAAMAVMMRLGCTRERARKACEAAVAGGWSTGKVRSQCEEWRRYCESERGSSLKAPGFFIASRIEDRQEAPYVPEPEKSMYDDLVDRGLIVT